MKGFEKEDALKELCYHFEDWKQLYKCKDFLAVAKVIAPICANGLSREDHVKENCVRLDSIILTNLPDQKNRMRRISMKTHIIRLISMERPIQSKKQATLLDRRILKLLFIRAMMNLKNIY
jgi:hypothetical protein